MRTACLTAALLLPLLTLPVAAGQKEKVPALLKLEVTDIDGKKLDLAKFQGKVLLIVNVASECGYTDQYKGLQALHAKYASKGLVILGVPCNDFGNQEPGSNAEIKEFAKKRYGTDFILLTKVKILGKDASPLYQQLQSKETNPKHAGAVRWNFEKFVIGRDGTVIARLPADADPEGRDLIDLLERELRP